MECKDVSITNLKLLKDTYEYFGDKRLLPRNMSTVFNRCFVTFTLYDLSVFEYLVIKNIATMTVKSYEEVDLEKFVAPMFEIFPHTLKKDLMKSTLDMTYRSELFSPMGLRKIGATATFSGIQLLILLHFNMGRVFNPSTETIDKNLFKALRSYVKEGVDRLNEIEKDRTAVEFTLNRYKTTSINDKSLLTSIYSNAGDIIPFVDVSLTEAEETIKNIRKAGDMKRKKWFGEIICNFPLALFIRYLCRDIELFDNEISLSDYKPFSELDIFDINRRAFVDMMLNNDEVTSITKFITDYESFIETYIKLLRATGRIIHPTNNLELILGCTNVPFSVIVNLSTNVTGTVNHPILGDRETYVLVDEECGFNLFSDRDIKDINYYHQSLMGSIHQAKNFMQNFIY